MTAIDTWSWWRVFSSSYKSYKWQRLTLDHGEGYSHPLISLTNDIFSWNISTVSKKRKQKLNSHHVVNCLLELRKICPAPFISHRYTVLICNSYDFEDTKLYPVLVTHNSELVYRPTRISIPILPLFRDDSLYWWSWWVRVLGDKYECR
jgi:hypothetical protein